MSEKGGFLFISHSHHDMDEVRKLRNKLEDEGFEPLCFYLKCLDENLDELHDLIKREIDARQWFVYARSPNSEASDYVQWERDWRKRSESKNDQELVWDLQSGISIDEISKMIIEGLRVHIIHDSKDIGFVDKLKNKLKEKDLQVTSSYDIDSPSGDDGMEQQADMVKQAGECGTNIVVLSKNSVHSDIVKNAVNAAFVYDSRLMAVNVDGVELEGELKFYLYTNQWISPGNSIKDEKDLDSFVEDVVMEIEYFFLNWKKS